jgi:integrase
MSTRPGQSATYLNCIHKILALGSLQTPIEAASSHRDATMILLAFRHGLRASELVDLRWDQVDFQAGFLHVRRAKAGTPATHPLTGRELRALRRLQRETGGTHLFMSERKAPISIDGFQKMVERLSIRANLGFRVHAHMLRHACARWPTTASTPARSKPTSVTKTSGTPCGTRN